TTARRLSNASSSRTTIRGRACCGYSRATKSTARRSSPVKRSPACGRRSSSTSASTRKFKGAQKKTPHSHAGLHGRKMGVGLSLAEALLFDFAAKRFDLVLRVVVGERGDQFAAT